MKKYLLVACALGLTACGSSTPDAPFPGEFANADYVLSDADAKKWVAMSNQTAQCIYPNLTRIQKEHFSKEDAYIHAQYVLFYPLEEMGENRMVLPILGA